MTICIVLRTDFPLEFQLAKRLMNPKRAGRPLPDEVIEEVCLSMSREYYDNAASGNLHHGDMKLAYDW